MNPDEAQHLLRRLETLYPESPDLIGYEPQTVPLDPERPEDAVLLAGQILNARDKGVRLRAVRDERGRLSLWREAYQFWIT